MKHFKNLYICLLAPAMCRYVRLLCVILLYVYLFVFFLFRPRDEKPYSFCLLRLVLRGLCIVIRLAFLAGTPGEERFQVILVVVMCTRFYFFYFLPTSDL